MLAPRGRLDFEEFYSSRRHLCVKMRRIPHGCTLERPHPGDSRLHVCLLVVSYAELSFGRCPALPARLFHHQRQRVVAVLTTRTLARFATSVNFSRVRPESVVKWEPQAKRIW